MLHVHDVYIVPTLPVTPVQLMRLGIGQNVSCTLGDCFASRSEACSRPRELWLSITLYSMLQERKEKVRKEKHLQPTTVSKAYKNTYMSQLPQLSILPALTA